jgi:hypothetical protein
MGGYTSLHSLASGNSQPSKDCGRLSWTLKIQGKCFMRLLLLAKSSLWFESKGESLLILREERTNILEPRSLKIRILNVVVVLRKIIPHNIIPVKQLNMSFNTYTLSVPLYSSSNLRQRISLRSCIHGENFRICPLEKKGLSAAGRRRCKS